MKSFAQAEGIPEYYKLNKINLIKALNSLDLSESNPIRDNLYDYTKNELREIALGYGIKGHTSLNKDGLVVKIIECDNGTYVFPKIENKKKLDLRSKLALAYNAEISKGRSTRTSQNSVRNIVSQPITYDRRLLNKKTRKNVSVTKPESVTPTSLFKLGTRMNLSSYSEQKRFSLENISDLGSEKTVNTFEQSMCSRKKTTPNECRFVLS